jgi:hypothetical protein
MFDATWHHNHWVGADGISLMVVCPPDLGDNRSNFWIPDGLASNSTEIPGWTRTGDPRNPPTLTIRPSIQTGSYHGFLTNGELVSC